MKKCYLVLIAAVLVCTGCAKASAPDKEAIYDSNPNHLWNRLNKTLFERTAPDGKTYGLNELDILYWYTTTNLLAGTSHQQALSVLDEFISKHGERLVGDPLPKALLQRDLWALFDWTAVPGPYARFPEGRRELQTRLAKLIRRLELTSNEIAGLPNNYVLAETKGLPDLPRGLFQTNSDWINVAVKTAELTVPAHVSGFGGRSVFTVWFHDADGREAGIEYLKRLSSFSPMLVPTTNRDRGEQMALNRQLPQFPTNSQWALVRQMCVVGTDGQPHPTPIIESIQLRTYWAIAPPDFMMVTNQNGTVLSSPVPPQHFYEFRMSRNAQANLLSIAQDGRAFSSNNRFFSMGLDPFEFTRRGQTIQDSRQEQTMVLRSCFQCHTAPGIYSVNSFTRFLSGGTSLVTTQMDDSIPEREQDTTLNWKLRQFDWGLLQGLWIRPD